MYSLQVEISRVKNQLLTIADQLEDAEGLEYDELLEQYEDYTEQLRELRELDAEAQDALRDLIDNERD